MFPKRTKTKIKGDEKVITEVGSFISGGIIALAEKFGYITNKEPFFYIIFIWFFLTFTLIQKLEEKKK